MSIVRVGSSAPYAAGWDHIFGGSKGKRGAKKASKKVARKVAKKASGVKAVKKKPRRAKK